LTLATLFSCPRLQIVTLSLLSWFVNREEKTNVDVNRLLVNISHSDATADKADDDVKATRGRDTKNDK